MRRWRRRLHPAQRSLRDSGLRPRGIRQGGQDVACDQLLQREEAGLCHLRGGQDRRGVGGGRQQAYDNKFLEVKGTTAVSAADHSGLGG